ncbi:glycoside hydrolase family 43 protein [Sunxiuqinia sp. A32]|uniref:glycoside hydrolase family 43 protein n=1 Tax=Sunxiuqinia sp. A32 TaxID=3461496 RepID=UPI004045F4DC
MSNNKILIVLFTFLVSFDMSCKSNPESIVKPESETETEEKANQDYFEYSNPQLYNSIDDGNMFRDPCIIKEGDTYYLTGTRWPHFEEWGVVNGTAIYASEDLKTWRLVCNPVTRPEANGLEWWKYYFWAPEMFVDNDKYYYTVNCSQNGPGGQLQEVALFVADQIEGPYTPISVDKSIIVGNDAHIFKDTDGKTYMFISGITGFEIDLMTGKIIGDVFECVKPTSDQGEWTSASATGFEGPYVMLRDGIYYLFFSTWARGYEIGYATATNIKGPWTMNSDPIYGSMNEAACARTGTTYESGYYENDFVESGHNTVFSGPDGRDWIVAHVFAQPFTGGYLENHVEMAFDPIEFRAGKIVVFDGSREVKGPTLGIKRILIEN